MSAVSRKPPAVRYPVRRSRSLGILLGAVVLLGTSGLCAWLYSSDDAAPGWATGFAIALGCVGAAGAVHSWWTQFSGDIHWDGHNWTLESPSAGIPWVALSGAPEVLVDVQMYLWLRARTPGHGPIWLWLERSSRPERWLDLRRAVYSRARPGAEHVDETAPASSRGRES